MRFGKRIPVLMMKFLIVLVFLFLFLSPLAASEKSWPLMFNAGPGWEIQYKGDGIDFFSFTRPKGENLVFTFHRWPAQGGPEQVAVYLRKIADSFSESTTWFTLPGMAKQKYEIDPVSGAEFSGEAAFLLPVRQSGQYRRRHPQRVAGWTVGPP